MANSILRLCLLLCASSLHLLSHAAENSWVPALTEHGYPDLQGYWTNPSMTPMQRPAALGNKSFYSEAEAEALIAAAFAKDELRQAPLSADRSAPEVGGAIDQQADGNFELMPTQIAWVNGEYRTSLMVKPDDGRFPLLDSFRDIYGEWAAQGHSRSDGPEFTPIGERCLNPGALLPLLTVFAGEAGGNPGGDNPVRNIQIVQTEDYVVILAEYNSMARVIPVSDTHQEGQGLKWMGDSIARYEDNKLHIHTKGLRPEQSSLFLRASSAMEVSETYELTEENALLLTVTIEDSNIYSESFTAEIPLARMPEGQLLYEYACHEGNYSMPSILRAARLNELR